MSVVCSHNMTCILAGSVSQLMRNLGTHTLQCVVPILYIFSARLSEDYNGVYVSFYSKRAEVRVRLVKRKKCVASS
jgi:hypothetical protein